MKEGWTYKKLGELCYISTGKHDANHAKEEGAYRFYTCASQYVYCDTFSFDGDCLILPGNGANVGEVYKFSGKFDAYQRTYVLSNIKKEEISFGYLYYYFLGNWKKQGSAKQYGAATNYIIMGNFTGFTIKYPVLSEQKRIVERLDSAFENIDKLKANAEKQLSEARILFQKSLAKAMEPKEGWEEKTLKDVADFVRGPFGGSLTKSMFKSEGYAVYEQQHAIHGHINIRYYIDSEKFKEMERFSVEAGDLIMSCSGVTLGRVNLLPSNTPAGIINQALLKMKVINNTDARYFKFWLESVHFQKIIKEYSGGAAIPNVPAVKILKDIKISIPSLAEQQRIVERLDSLSENVRKYEEIQRQIISECDALKQALLRKVFE